MSELERVQLDAALGRGRLELFALLGPEHGAVDAKAGGGEVQRGLHPDARCPRR